MRQHGASVKPLAGALSDALDACGFGFDLGVHRLFGAWGEQVSGLVQGGAAGETALTVTATDVAYVVRVDAEPPVAVPSWSDVLTTLGIGEGQ